MKKVVITGYGIISCIGNSKSEVIQSLQQGNSGISTNATYADMGFRSHVSGSINLELENFIEFDRKLYVHAGFSHPKGPGEEFQRHMVYWDRSLWETARAAHQLKDEDSWQYPERLKLYSEIYIGHTPVQRIGASTPFRASNVWNIDTGAAFDGPLSMINTETKAYWQSDPLPSLYPNEIGRQA